MMIKPQGPNVVKGVDISHYEIVQSFDMLKSKLYGFCFIKACEGPSVDVRFREHWTKSRDAGLLRGAYCYFHPGHDPIGQANLLCDLVGKLEPGDLPCVLDWETAEGTSRNSDVGAALHFLETVEARTRRTPIIYGSPYFLHQFFPLTKDFGRYPLWIAHYLVKAPLVPMPWDNWTFWQYTENGVTARDLNLFNGDLKQLQALAGII